MKSFLFLCFITSILFLPFINKAISGDSIFYIYTAKQILNEPLKPFDFQINCAEKNYNARDIANNPPLISYLLAGIIKVFGESEKVFHLIFFIFTIFAVVGMYFLSKELSINPFFSALLLIASPAFFVNATDIMLDVPLLAFSLWGVYFAIKQKISGWLLLGFALLIKFVAIVNLPILFFWFLLSKNLKKNLKFFVIPLLFLGVWCGHNLIIYNEVQILKKSLSVGLSFSFVKEIPILTYIGGAFIFPVSILWLIFNAREKNIYFFVVVFSVVNFLFNLLDYTIFQSFLLGLFICCAVFLIFVFIDYLIKTNFEKEIIFLFSWFFLYVVFFMSVSSIVAVRYLLPFLPPAIMLFVKMSEKLPVHKTFLATTVIVGIILSLFLAKSDYVLANSYRKIANYVKSNYTGKVYFRGDMSFRGFQYYMEKNGFICLTERNEDNLQVDYLVTSIFSVRRKLKIEKCEERLYEKYVFTKNPFRTMSPECQAGFHLNMYGLLPYGFSNYPLEKFTIYCTGI